MILLKTFFYVTVLLEWVLVLENFKFKIFQRED